MIYRVEVRPAPHAGDPVGAAVLERAASLGLVPLAVHAARVYLIEANLEPDELARLCDHLLADPVLEEARLGASPVEPGVRCIEVHPRPGVMDPVAGTVRMAIEELAGKPGARVVTGWRYDIEGLTEDEARALAERLLANPLIEQIHDGPYHPDSFPTLAPADQRVVRVAMRELSDEELSRMSREKHLFLSLDEMRAIRSHYRDAGRDPTDVELETLAQTWSEHCVHKTLKSTVRYTGDVESDIIDWRNRPGHTLNADGSVTIDNLLRSTVAAATNELIADGLDWALSVFVDNAGVIALDERYAICMKVETHNHPSALEPYGGAATGIGGCIRDIMGTGLAARPIANTDVFCVAHPDIERVPSGCLHPRRVLERVIDGVRDYGNRMGIPTVNGAVYFDDRYVGNPLVFCGCVGLMPRDKVSGEAKPGDVIVAMGGRTGRDGIHGATFSSAELTDTHADEFSHAVQIGNPIEEKRTLDAILRARDHEGRCLFSAITDCGAGGFSSAVGEMGEKIGAEVDLDRAPLKYDGLRYDEIWISESQERMVLAVPRENIDALRTICAEEHVEVCELGTFGRTGDNGNAELLLRYNGVEVGRLDMDFLHNGIPMPRREAVWKPASAAAAPARGVPVPVDLGETLTRLLAHPNIASKRWIVSQYDHEVQGNTIIKPLVGPGGIGPGDATVIEPVPGSGRGIAIACGLQTRLGHPDVPGSDPYLMALAAVDECVRNVVCVGADPARIAILDNFCWPSCAEPENMGALVRAAEGCYDAARAYAIPFISGKDSLNNQFRADDGTLIEIPPTLLISGVGIVNDLDTCITSDAKPIDGSILVLIGPTDASFGASHYAMMNGLDSGAPAPIHLEQAARTARVVAELIASGLVVAAHDCSEGGLAIAVAEMLIGAHERDAGVGAELGLHDVEERDADARAWFGEAPGRYVLQLRSRDDLGRASELLGDVPHRMIGTIDLSSRLYIHGFEGDVAVAQLRDAFTGTLDW